MSSNNRPLAITADSHPVITYQDLRVTTTELLAQFYGTDVIRIQQNFTRNADRFVEGKHYFKLEGENLRQFKQLGMLSFSEYPALKTTSRLTLWTQRGAARHAKILDTDKAWDVFEVLEDAYFKAQPINPPADKKQYTEIDVLKIASIASRAVKSLGFTGNQATLSADRAVKKITGQSPLELIGQTHLLADQRGRTYTPTELGKMLDPPRSGRMINQMLQAFQLIEKDVKGDWIPTAKAVELYEWLDTSKRHSDGTPVKQLKWFPAVFDAIEMEYREQNKPRLH
ncbi:ORF6N domain-containing protein [Rhodoferax sp. 4810]|uniref:ORF6N domain-containing protein n=1 Tax=Thiospirillum jenense TaxID=1653858 RepID=A0A839H7K1_9GAMM|nr:ORF6N domain-containing protein [Thiospirillum jenense]MBB1074456.1 ORF6N domain-containing protein [Rhodoferax jenense]MBB1125565.1 ORF6N domain-containing protein [Thiospirillum jenense]